MTAQLQPPKTVIRVGDEEIGGTSLTLIAGPCVIESREQAFAVAAAVRDSGAKFFRGAAFKPRSSPYTFSGLGAAALEITVDVRAEYGLKIVTEALDERTLELVERHSDVIQIGARNMQNFSLLSRAGKSHLPVLLKRGLASTLDEWLLAAEYLVSEGNGNVILCERGFRSFVTHSRATLDLAAIPALRRVSHLPVLVDPSHAAGLNYLVAPLARAAVAAGADGLLVEVHDNPEVARCDAAQALTIPNYKQMINEVLTVYEGLSQLHAR